MNLLKPMKITCKMAVVGKHRRRMASPLWFVLILLVLSGCAVSKTEPIKRIALLAPFEGRYREVGYQALYAGRMAIAEANRIDLELLAVDDGGSVETAIDRSNALNNDPLIEIILVLGIHAADEQVVKLLQPPMIMVGEWDDNELAELAAQTDPFTCGSLCLIPSFALLAENPALATIKVSAEPVDDAFRERYVNFDQFVPEPLPIAQQAYSATRYAIATVIGEAIAPTYASRNFTYIYTADGELTLVE
jgi:hypothetical protein